MGSMIQTYQLKEADFRGDRFKSFAHDLQGNNDLLSLTRPDVIEEIHSRLLRGRRRHGGNEHVQHHLDRHGRLPLRVDRDANSISLPSPCARRAAQKAEAATPGRRCFVAGAIGPLNRTLSMSPDVNRPDYRAVTWDQVVAAYTEQINALLDGGVDALLVETIFDTLNSKAALFAIETVFDERGDTRACP